jgi:signal transduction histidine kinase
MQERAQSIGGHLKLENNPSNGVRVEIRIPTRSVAYKEQIL